MDYGKQSQKVPKEENKRNSVEKFRVRLHKRGCLACNVILFPSHGLMFTSNIRNIYSIDFLLPKNILFAERIAIN